MAPTGNSTPEPEQSVTWFHKAIIYIEETWKLIAACAGIVAVLGGAVTAAIHYVGHSPTAVVAATSTTGPPSQSPSTVINPPTSTTPSATDTTPAPDAPSPTTGTTVGSGPQYLADLPVAADQSGGESGGSNQVTISRVAYLKSPMVVCVSTGSYVDWAVPAGVTGFHTVVGIDDNASSGAVGESAHLNFTDQDQHSLNPPVAVSIGHPQTVSLTLGSAIRLRITCISSGTPQNPTPAWPVALGDAVFTTQ
jgi:hypothetical protein